MTGENIDFTSTYLGITTGIKFKLYISDYYDNLIYKSLIEKYGDKNSYQVTVDELYDAFYDYPEIRDILKVLEKDYDDDEIVEINTIVFIASILETYQNYDLDKLKAKYGIFAVSGNHEYYIGIQRYETLCKKF